MSAKRQVAKVFGAVVFLAEIVVLVALAYVTASGNVGELTKFIKPQFLTPPALLIYMLAAAILIKYGAGEATDVTHLQEGTLRLQSELDELRAQSLPRRLREDQQRAIAQVVRTGLHDLWERQRASPSWSADDKEGMIFVELYSVESERETAVYRADFEKALKDGGLGVALGEIVGTLGESGNEEFVGVVSILRRPGNLVRPFVLEALRSAGISVNECDDLPNGLARYNHGKGGERLGVTLVIGQHG